MKAPPDSEAVFAMLLAMLKAGCVLREDPNGQWWAHHPVDHDRQPLPVSASMADRLMATDGVQAHRTAPGEH